jgi:hypothetical protein
VSKIPLMVVFQSQRLSEIASQVFKNKRLACKVFINQYFGRQRSRLSGLVGIVPTDVRTTVEERPFRAAY